MSQRFFLDPDYEYYNPTTTPLKFSTVMQDGVGCFPVLLTLLLFIPLAWIMLSTVHQMVDERFGQFGLSTQATLTGCDWQRGAPRSSSRLYVFYTYSDEKGEEHSGSDRIFNAPNVCAQMPQGAVIQIQYDGVHPWNARVTDERLLPSVWFVGSVSLIAFIGFLLMLLMIIWATREGFWALKAYGSYEALKFNSILIEGEIVEAQGELTGKKRDAYMVSVRYRVKLPTGKGIVRVQKHRRDDLRNQPLPQPGTPVAVLYAHENSTVML